MSLKGIVNLLNALVIGTDFLSFVFLTPQIAGKSQLVNLEKRIRTTINCLGAGIFLSMFIACMILMFIFQSPLMLDGGSAELESILPGGGDIWLKIIIITFVIVASLFALTALIEQASKWVHKVTEDDQTIAQRWAQVGIYLFLAGRLVSFITLGLETQIE